MIEDTCLYRNSSFYCIIISIHYYYYPRHGMYRTDHLIYNDPELSFLESIPKSALFTPNPSQDDVIMSNNNNNDDDDNDVTMETSPHPNDNESESEEEQDKSEKDGEVGVTKGKISALNSTPVPLGWPKVTIVIDMYMYMYINIFVVAGESFSYTS